MTIDSHTLVDEMSEQMVNVSISIRNEHQSRFTNMPLYQFDTQFLIVSAMTNLDHNLSLCTLLHRNIHMGVVDKTIFLDMHHHDHHLRSIAVDRLDPIYFFRGLYFDKRRIQINSSQLSKWNKSIPVMLLP